MANVPVVELQEMQNHMRATLDRGLEELRSKQGQGDIPALPPAAAAPVQQAAYAANIQPDTAAAGEIAQAAQEADRAGQDALAQSSAAGNAPSVTISLGQSTDEVIAALGRPPKTANLGAKQIFIYNDMKITFQDGRVTDVQ